MTNNNTRKLKERSNLYNLRLNIIIRILKAKRDTFKIATLKQTRSLFYIATLKQTRSLFHIATLKQTRLFLYRNTNAKIAICP